MDGFKMAGKAFCVVEDFRQLTKQYKGMTVAEFLKLLRLEEAVAKQFGMTLAEYRQCIGK